jgi:glycosyltransferase involved in cell wall biosynthesis
VQWRRKISPIRIALIAKDIPDYCIEFAKTAAQQASVLLCIADTYVPTCAKQHEQLEIARLAWPRQREAKNVLFVNRLAKTIRNWQPDIVHILQEDWVWHSAIALLLREFPVITTVHDIQLHPGDVATAVLPRFFVNMVVRQSRAVVVHGETLKADAARVFKIAPGKIHVVPHPPIWHYSKLARKQGFHRPADQIFRVLFFGRIYRYKGLDYLLEAVHLIERKVPDFKITIAGRGDGLQIYSELLSGLCSVDIYNYFISSELAARLFAEADLVVLPYTEASQSGVLMIAMAFGLPVVATDVGEIATTVKSTQMGILVKPRDCQGLAAAIIKLAHDESLRLQLAANAVRAVQGPYSREVLSQRIAAVYNAVLKQG